MRFRLVAESYDEMEIFKASIKEVVLLEKGKWGIIVDFVLEESKLVQCIIDLQSISLLNLLGVSKTVEIGAA